EGALYPRLTELREVSVQIACSVIKSLRSQGLAPPLDDTDAELEERVRDAFFEPEYAT
ncbi:MAG: malic enzyme, partial [Planctomycetota bacterium]